MTDCLDVSLVCDVMMDLQGAIRPAVYLAYELTKRGYKVSIFSPIISRDVEEHLRTFGITPVNLHVRPFAKYSGFSLLWFELWAREALFRLNSKHIFAHSPVTINFSHTFAVSSRFWYVQGPTSVALRDGENELLGVYKFGYKILEPTINYADKRLVKDMAKRTVFIIANSDFCASIYKNWGISIRGVIYPPIDCKIFQPHTSRPSSDYVLTYFGKETEFTVIKAVADSGVSIKAFGAKLPFMPKSLSSHPNVDILGRVSTDTLVELYSNALFTFFPFTHEPFGYIPVESMACGTPVLTYNMQGPRESVIDGHTGWLVESSQELIHKALRLWKQGYAPQIRSNCVKMASMFDRKFYVKKWLETLKSENSG